MTDFGNIEKAASDILISALSSLPPDVDHWTVDDKLIAQNLVHQFLECNRTIQHLPKVENTSVISCVYCGYQFPEGTPPHGAQILTEHIKVCEKHPMRELESRVTELENTLKLVHFELSTMPEKMPGSYAVKASLNHIKKVMP